MGSEIQASQASSHYPLEPVTGSTLFGLESAWRQSLGSRGTLRTGCREVDEQVLVDGFERGAVVGVSAEEIDTGLLVGVVSLFPSRSRSGHCRLYRLSSVARPADHSS